MLLERAYYKVKPFVPAALLLALRRLRVSLLLSRNSENWPIDKNSARHPRDWAGWPQGKKFAFVLTHDVESKRGLDRCLELASIEEELGFRSSFNFVAKDYDTPLSIRNELISRGFELGVHGLHHRVNMFRSKREYRQFSNEINFYLKEWKSVGFRHPSMYHNLDMLQELDIEYDSSTFDTDPFEPQPSGVKTIFPFWVAAFNRPKGFIELPYTLPQDFLLFILMREESFGIWKHKLEWIAQHSGMALLNTHPDYMSFNNDLKRDEFPIRLYKEFLLFVRDTYGGQYWHALPKEVAYFWKKHYAREVDAPRKPLHVCMPAYSFYTSDNRIRRYAETLASRGDRVEILALGRKGEPRHEAVQGVKLSRIQNRKISEKNRFSYLAKLIFFLLRSFWIISLRQSNDPYDFIHVHSVPDFEVFASVIPKARGAKIVLDIHDIVPEFYSSKFGKSHSSILFKLLAWIEKVSCRYADHVIISNHLWFETITSRSVKTGNCTTILNYPNEEIFFKRPKKDSHEKVILLYPGTIAAHQGLDLAVKAFALIREKVPKAEFHIYGAGPSTESLRHLINQPRIGERVFLHDIVPLDKISTIMANADIGIVPKKEDFFSGSAFSTKILEFMALGVPVIVAATKIDKHYFNASIVKFFKPGDIEELARCMVSMIIDKEMRDRLSRSASVFVQDFLWSKKQLDYLELIDRLLASRYSSRETQRGKS